MRSALVVATVSAGLALGAEHATSQPIELGAMAGLNFATMSLEGLTGNGSKEGLLVGGFVAVRVHRLFLLQPELLYTRKGTDLSPVIADLAQDTSLGGNVGFAYLELPVLLRLTPVTAARVRPSVFAGPVVGIEVSCRVTAREGALIADESCSRVGFETSTTDLGFVIGGRAEIGIAPSVGGSGALFLELRYTHGLRNVNTLDDAEARSWRHRVVTLGLGARFTAAR